MSYSDYYNLIKNYLLYIFSYFFLILCKDFIYFASNYGIITDIKIKLCK